jgi:glyoxylase I family protein
VNDSQRPLLARGGTLSVTDEDSRSLRRYSVRGRQAWLSNDETIVYDTRHDKGQIDPLRIHHLALRTRDPGRLESFYVDLLGLRRTRTQGDLSVWLSSGDAILMIERAAEGEPPIPHGSMEMVAFGIPASERDTVVARLRDASVAIEAETRFTVYFRDPDGRRVGVSHFPDERT